MMAVEEFLIKYRSLNWIINHSCMGESLPSWNRVNVLASGSLKRMERQLLGRWETYGRKNNLGGGGVWKDLGQIRVKQLEKEPFKTF